jgi:AcrR family transcriptional regulator
VKRQLGNLWGDESSDKDEIVHVRRRQGRSMEKRNRILAAAAQEFAENGFDGATTRSIALRAGLRHALVIYHFETKIGLWQAVMHYVVNWYQEAFNSRLQGLAGVDDVTKLRLLQAEFIRIAAQHPELHWLMSHESRQGGDRLKWLIDNILRSSFEQFIELIASAQRTGNFIQGDPWHLHYIFLGAAARIFMLSYEVEALSGKSPFDSDFIEEHIRLCQEMFFR